MFQLIYCMLFLVLLKIQESVNQHPRVFSWRDSTKCQNCISITSCPALHDIIQATPMSSQDYLFYKKLSCGFDGFTPLYCCDEGMIEEVFGGNQETAEDVFARTDDEELSAEVVGRLLKNHLECGARRESRIVGGDDAPPGRFPFVVNLGYSVWSEEERSAPLYRCGGSLISSQHVLTAAHCVRGLPPFHSMTTVRVGEHQDDGSNIFRPEWRRTHPDYNRVKLINDIAIVKLNRQVMLSDEVRPICLPFGNQHQDMKILESRSSFVAGWGAIDSKSPPTLPKNLQYTRLNLLDKEVCSKILSSNYSYELSEKQLCTLSQDGRDSCGGDSGGPLFVQDEGTGTVTLLGLVSFGAKKCGDPNIPGVYTDVTAYRDFILDNLT